MSIYQDLVELFGFTHRYNSVKRFVNALKVHITVDHERGFQRNVNAYSSGT